MSAVRLRIAGALALLACALVQAKIPGTDPPLPITVNTPPSLTNHSSKLIIIREKVQFELVCEGHSASKQGDEQAELEFLWKKDGVFYERDSWRVFQPDNAGTLTFTQAMEEDAGIYQCLVKNSLGTAVTQYTDVLYGHVGDFSPPVVKEHSVRNGDALHLKCDKIPVSIPPAQLMWTYRPKEQKKNGMMWSIISEPAGGGDKLEGLPQAVDEDKRIAYDEKGDMYFPYVTA
ncbi:PREDICTED: neural cell adhesion molecule L1-like protein, partial [Priapulus caudatus]|uniref:Neural cell adhesion molecule L1-like protein n=1 Tax=Priapulus caudatus TaxID=37621 RepID=A0ABM1F5K9_PRICU